MRGRDNIKTCYKCGITEDKVKLFNTFGKFICQDCLDKRKTGRKGHSGMVYDENIKEEDYFDNELKNEPLSLKQVTKSNKLFVKWFIEHYPKSKGIVGRTLNFLIYSNGNPIGIIGFASPPLNYKKFNTYFGLDENNKPSENAKLFLNNNVFRIIHTEKNLATKVLKMARKIVFDIYKEKYNQELLGLVTFVEPPRTGALYKADNWDYLGKTEGIEVKRRGEDWTNKQYIKGISKLIYGYTYKINKKIKKSIAIYETA